MTGQLIDGTGFAPNMSPFELCAELKQLGFTGNGMETMIDGETGLLIERQVIMAPIALYRAKHLVEYKKYVHSTGNIDKITRQPANGRQFEGGHRFGEMEKDILVGYNAVHNTLDRLVTCCDAYNARVCPFGHMDGYRNDQNKCFCGEITKTVKTRYSYKLCIQELQGLNIDAKHSII
jgi:DNA-directed RNA polymerase beta subunit